MTRPLLRTDRLDLHPLTDEHLDQLVALDADPAVMRFLTGRASTREQVEAMQRRRTDAAYDAAGLGYWVGFAAGEFIGWWCLTPPDRPDQGSAQGQAELGYRLARRHWRAGFATEGSRAVLRHGFETVRLHRIFAETMAVNQGSRAVLAALELSFVRSFHEHFDEPLPGADQGEVEYAVTAADWLSRRTGGGTTPR